MRIRANFLYGTLTDNPLALGAVVANSVEFANLPVVTSPDIMEMSFDPKAVYGAPEIVHVIAHSANSTTINITRGEEGTTARTHFVGEVWVHAESALDLNATTTPSTSNVGDVATLGTSDAFAKGDHLHGREGFSASLPSTVTVTAGSVGSSASPARSDHLHPAAISTPTTSIPTDTNAAGSGPTLSASDHKHGREGFGSPNVSTASDTVNQGSQTTVSRSDHQHGREGYGTPGSSNPLDSASAGTATSLSRSDHKHGREGVGNPTTINSGDPTQLGIGPFISYADHRHGKPAPTFVLGYMDNTSPTFGAPSTQLATISTAGPPFATVTVPSSGIVRIDWSITAAGTGGGSSDLVPGIGIGGTGRGGAWPGTSTLLFPGQSGTDWVMLAPWGSMVSGTNLTISGSALLTTAYAGLVKTFYLLWGSVGGALSCDAIGRGCCRKGTTIQVTTVP